MKKILRSVAALAVVMFAGCTTDMTDEVVAPVTGETTTITVGFDETKTSLGELVDGVRKVYWSNGDQIAVNGVVSAAATINEENKGVATFTFESALATPYSALYPAEAYVDAQTINLPSNQGLGVDNVGADALPMAAYSTVEGGALVMHHLAGAFRFRIKQSATESADIHEIHHVELRGNNGEQLSGNFAIDYEAVTLTATSTNEADKVAYSLVNKDSSTENELNVFVVVPAGAYEQGVTLRIVDVAGHYMDVKSTATTIAKGEIKAMPAVEFVPTGTLINVEIKSVADLVLQR